MFAATWPSNSSSPDGVLEASANTLNPRKRHHAFAIRCRLPPGQSHETTPPPLMRLAVGVSLSRGSLQSSGFGRQLRCSDEIYKTELAGDFQKVPQ